MTVGTLAGIPENPFQAATAAQDHKADVSGNEIRRHGGGVRGHRHGKVGEAAFT